MHARVYYVLTAVTSLMANSCSSLTFSTKNGVIPMEETWRRGTQRWEKESAAGGGWRRCHRKDGDDVIRQDAVVAVSQHVFLSGVLHSQEEFCALLMHTRQIAFCAPPVPLHGLASKVYHS